MVSYIRGYLDDVTNGELKISVEDLLSLIEAYGMSPPGYPSNLFEGEGDTIYEWEPEDET